jgi:glycosyltransferase involved in cell wall biosynthesis
MACETPVVSTPKGCAALNVVPERDLLVADDAQTFATALLDLIGDPDRQRQIGQAGCSYVNENYSWARNSVQLQQVYHETIRQYRQ